MKEEIREEVTPLLAEYDPKQPRVTADALRRIWIGFQPKSIEGIKAEERARQETLGIPVPVLRAIGSELGRVAGKRVDDFIPLTKTLWNEYGREGRVVVVYPIGKMELAAPETVLPLTVDLCRSCHTWEDADQLAMRGVEPIVRKDPEGWLGAIEPWLDDDNKWVRRAGVTVAGRLPMKHPAYTERCLVLAGRLLLDEEGVVKKATSFAIRICARGDIDAVRKFLAQHVPPADRRSTWVLCDVIRSMTKVFLPELSELLPQYESWLTDPSLSAQERRSVESAVKMIKKTTLT